jgi:hypothetical protein
MAPVGREGRWEISRGYACVDFAFPSGRDALMRLSAGFAADKKAAPPPADPRIGVLEQQLRDVQQQLARSKAQADADTARAGAT